MVNLQEAYETTCTLTNNTVTFPEIRVLVESGIDPEMRSEITAREFARNRSAITVRVKFMGRVCPGPIWPAGIGAWPTSCPRYSRKAELSSNFKPTLLGFLTVMAASTVTLNRTFMRRASNAMSAFRSATELTVVMGRRALKTVAPRTERSRTRPMSTAETTRQQRRLRRRLSSESMPLSGLGCGLGVELGFSFLSSMGLNR